MELDVVSHDAATEIGSRFISNYPPFSVWLPRHVPAAEAALDAPPPDSATPIGLYLHIPFCRKRCHFCYFRVYTGRNSSEVDDYVQALSREVALYARRGCLRGRQFDFVYFGGGTPSFLSSEQLERLVARIREHWTWEHAREVTFECEPGTLKKSKLQTIRGIGVTRLSLGIEHFDDEVLEINGRAHKSPEILRAYAWAREVGFPQINVDLIAGMVGETEEKWVETVDKTLALRPDSLTIYQMEVPHNTDIARQSRESGRATPVAGWATKRRWVDYAFNVFRQAGYVVSSAYTVVRPSEHQGFVYRDAIWHGAHMIGTGVASFGHVSGVHYQNEDEWGPYMERLARGELPLARALPITAHQRLIREMILQLKLGRLEVAYFQDKFGTDIRTTFAEPFDVLVRQGYAEVGNGAITLSREGLLRVDGLLPGFFEPQFRNVRYT
ncbi:MAG: coproporphyrinogen III oxidase family protein [Phycisphaerales bacterium]|nr:MAG: coproporphyrinogen III oxidase family protein [Phycisphaerales bacterium]